MGRIWKMTMEKREELTMEGTIMGRGEEGILAKKNKRSFNRIEKKGKEKK
jgi:hypothetical protein